MGFWSLLAEDQGRTLTLRVRVDRPAAVRSSEADLAAAVDVLLDNVFSHTPDGADVLLTLDARPEGGARLVVADAGPGLASTDLAERGTSGGDSTGLGLSIATRTAAESGGSLTLGRSDELGGAEVVVDLGPAVS